MKQATKSKFNRRMIAILMALSLVAIALPLGGSSDAPEPADIPAMFSELLSTPVAQVPGSQVTQRAEADGSIVFYFDNENNWVCLREFDIVRGSFRLTSVSFEFFYWDEELFCPYYGGPLPVQLPEGGVAGLVSFTPRWERIGDGCGSATASHWNFWVSA